MNYSPSLSRRNKSIANICLKKGIADRTHIVKKIMDPTMMLEKYLVNDGILGECHGRDVRR